MSGLRYILPAALAITSIGAAHAQAGGGDGGSAKALNKILAVLQLDPNAASDSCVDALNELHKTEKVVASDQGDHSNRAKQELPVARDVLESNFDDAAEICGADARTLCRSKGPTLPNGAATCDALRAPGGPAPEDD